MKKERKILKRELIEQVEKLSSEVDALRRGLLARQEELGTWQRRAAELETELSPLRRQPSEFEHQIVKLAKEQLEICQAEKQLIMCQLREANEAIKTERAGISILHNYAFKWGIK